MGGGGIFIFTDKTEQKLCFIDSSTKSKNLFMLRDLMI